MFVHLKSGSRGLKGDGKKVWPTLTGGKLAWLFRNEVLGRIVGQRLKYRKIIMIMLDKSVREGRVCV